MRRLFFAAALALAGCGQLVEFALPDAGQAPVDAAAPVDEATPADAAADLLDLAPPPDLAPTDGGTD